MIIWIVGSLLVALAALLGFYMGGIRTSISLVGTVVAAFTAKLVGTWVAGVVPLIGFKNAIWQFYLPPLVGFILVSLVFSIIAFVVHHQIQSRYRDRTDGYTYARWFRLNRRTGTALGAALGTVWLILLAVVVYVPAYLTTQLADDNEDSVVLKSANSFAHGMEDTGLLRIVEHYQPATENHFLASDILGLVYNNAALQSRLASYPPFLGLSEKPEIAELGRDPEVNTLIQSRAGVMPILENPKVRAVTENPELMSDLLALDLPDLNGYLRSGISEKYKNERILGRWRLNVRRSIAAMKLTSSEKLPPVEFNLLRRALNVYLDDMTLGFTTDNKALLKVKAKDDQKLQQVVGRAGAATPSTAAPSTDPNDPSSPPPAVGTGPGLTPRSLAARAIPQPSEGGVEMDPALRARYGLGGAGGTAGAAAAGARTLASSGGPVINRAPARASRSTVLAPLMSTRDGGWARSGGDYQIRFPADEGKEVVLEATVKDNQLEAIVDGRALVFDRI